MGRAVVIAVVAATVATTATSCRAPVPRRALERAPAPSIATGPTHALTGTVTVHALSRYLTAGRSTADACRVAVVAGATAAALPGGLLGVDRGSPRRPIVMLNAWEHDAIATIKAADPDVKAIVYKDMSSTRDYPGAVDDGRDAPLLPAGVGYVDASAHHPDWFLTGRDGRRLTYDGYPGHWQMDVGNPDYQRAWLDRVTAEVRANGWDGVFVDNALALADSYHPGVRPARYPTDDAFHAAYRSMLAGIGARMHAGGFIAVANISDAYRFAGLWQDWVALIDGAIQEHFANWNTTAGQGFLSDSGADSAWRGHVDELAAAAKVGRFGWAVVKGAPGDVDLFRYGYGSYLLTADDRSVITVGEPATWIPELDWDLGPPSGPRRSDGTTYRRDFAHGVVVVNASDHASVTVSLGATYVDVTGASRDRVTVAPTRAAILRTPDAPTVAPGLASASASAPTVAPTPDAPTVAPTPEPAPAPAARPGTEVVVSDGAGRVLASAPLGDAVATGEMCAVRFSVAVPGAAIYRVAVPGRASQVFSAAELEARNWAVSVS